MRDLINLLEASKQKLSFDDAKAFIADLEQARGRIPELARTYPWLVGYCQEAAQDRLGSTFSVFRGLTLTSDLRGDKIASTSLNWRVAYDIIEGSPGMIMHGNRTYTPTKAILHYRITPAHVVMWIPVALDFVKQSVGKRTNHSIEDRYGEPMKIAKVLQAIEQMDEQEIVADLNGLTPKVVQFDTSLIGNEKLEVFREFMRGNIDMSDVEGWCEKNYIRFIDPDDVLELCAEYAKWKL